MVSLLCCCISDWSLSFIIAMAICDPRMRDARCDMRNAKCETERIEAKSKASKSTIDINILSFFHIIENVV